MSKINLSNYIIKKEIMTNTLGIVRGTTKHQECRQTQKKYLKEKDAPTNCIHNE